MSALRFLRQAAPSFKGRLPEGFARSFAKSTGSAARPLNRANPIVGPARSAPTRSTPIVTPGTNKNLIQQASQYGSNLLQNPYAQGLTAILGLPTGAAGLAFIEGSTPQTGKEYNPGPLISIGLDGIKFRTGPTKDKNTGRDQYGNLTNAEEVSQIQQYDREQGADLDMDAIKNLPGGANNPLPPFNPDQDLPASAEQSLDPTPLQHQMAIYEQGRNAATTQAERNQVRDLGLAIHKAHNPHLYSSFRPPMVSDKPFSPSLAGQPTAVFPDGYPETLEAFVKEGGVRMPYTMNDADARKAVVDGNRLEGEARAARLAADLEAQEFMKKFLAGQK